MSTIDGNSPTGNDESGKGDDPGTDEQSVDAVVARFTSAETALREILKSAQGLTTAREELVAARETQSASLEKLEAARRTIREELEAADARDVERLDATIAAVESHLASIESAVVARIDGAERSLEASQHAVADAASSVFELAMEMKSVARDMKDTANVFRSIDPEGLRRDVAALTDVQHGLTVRTAAVESQLGLVRNLVVASVVIAAVTAVLTLVV